MKRFTLICAAMAAAITASAQWNTDKNPVQIGNATKTNSPQAVLTEDGKMYVSWRSSARVGNALCYSFPHLQLLDKDGKVMFGESGLDVATHKSSSWNSAYTLAVTPDGSAIQSNADARSIEAEDLDVYNNFTPVWYKISQDQEFQWGIDGLALTDRINSPFTDTYVIGNDVWIMDRTSEYGEVNYTNRVNEDGTLGFTESQKIFGQLVPSEGTDFICINSGSDGPEAQRYSRDGKAVWSEPVTFATQGYGGHNLHPYTIGADGKGGAFVSWVRFMGQFGHMVCAQHIDKDGSPTFGLDAMDVYAVEEGDHDYEKMGVDTKNGRALVTWAIQQGGGTYDLRAQLFNEEGDRLFGDNGKIIATKDGDMAGWAYNNFGVQPVGDGDWLVCYADVTGWEQLNFFVERIDKDGNQVWKQQIGENGQFDDVNFLKGDGCSYVVFKTKNEDGYSILKVARIFDNGTFDNATPLPYSNDFTAAKPTDWAYLDKSVPASDYGHWAYGNISVGKGKNMTYTNCVYTGMNLDDTPWNDYYISPMFNLDASKTYKVKTQTYRDGESYKLSLEYGTSLTDDATYKKFADCTMQNSAFDKEKFDEATLKVDESGIYRIAFHITSTAKSPTDTAALMSFSIEEDNTSGIESVDNSISDITSAAIYSVDGKLVKTIQNGKFDAATLAPGMYIVTVKDAQGHTKSMKITK